MPLNPFRNKKEFQVGQLGEVGVLVQNMQTQANDTADTQTFQQDQRTIRQFVTNQIKESVYFFEPLTYGGINKTANRLFTEWFRMDSATFGKDMDQNVRQGLEDFHKKIRLKAKITQAAIDAMVYGNGFLELVAANGIQERNTPLPPQGGLKDVVIADPLYIQPTIEWINQANDEFYYLEQPPNGVLRKIHNSRIIHIPWATLGTMRFGRSVIEIAIRSLLAKMNMDWALGEVIYRHGKPFIVLKTTGAGSKELQKAYQVLQNINPRTHFAGTERHDFQMLNPSVVDPDPFAKYYYHNLAAALEMPQMEFLGAQSGALTGSEIDKIGWLSNLKAKQENKFTDVIHRINNQYLKGDWHDEIFWNDIFADEKSQADIMKVQAETVKILYFDASLMTDIEARQLCRDMGITFPEDDSEFIAEEAAKPEPSVMPLVNSMIPQGDQTGNLKDTTGKPQIDADKKDFIRANETYWNEGRIRHGGKPV